MDTIIYKRIVGGWMFAFPEYWNSARRYFGYSKKEAYREFKKFHNIQRAHLIYEEHSMAYGFAF